MTTTMVTMNNNKHMHHCDVVTIRNEVSFIVSGYSVRCEGCLGQKGQGVISF